MKLELFCDSMKVTVCFNDVRVVVPCGNGEMLVGDLMEDAVVRYKKAVGLSPVCKVLVRHLKLGVGDGILDEGDRVADVIEDKDQIIAEFRAVELDTSRQSADVKKNWRHQDGQAVNSGTKSSPESVLHTKDAKTDFQIDVNSNWMKKSGSKISGVLSNVEPAVNNRTGPAENKMMAGDSAAGVGNASHHHLQQNPFSQTPVLKKILKKSKEDEKKQMDSAQNQTDSNKNSDYSPATSPEIIASFARDSSRKSLSNQMVMSKWFDAQERTLDSYESENQPLEQHKRPIARPSSFCYDEGTRRSDSTVVTGQTDSPCGTGSVQPRNQNSGVIDANTKGWRSSFYSSSPVSQVNSGSQPLYQSLNTRKKRRAPEAPVSSSANSRLLPSLESVAVSEACPAAASDSKSSENIAKREPIPPPITVTSPSTDDARCGTSGESVESPLATVGGNSSDPKNVNKLTPSKKGVLAPTNTRLIGKKIVVRLTKGSNGLGFSITTRDNITISDCPIYIKNILPVGAAVEDGRLKAGDRLLLVNQVEMTGKTQSEAVQILRNISANSTVEITVSRQVSSDEEEEDDLESFEVDSNATISTTETLVPGASSTPETVKLVRKDSANTLPALDADADAHSDAVCIDRGTHESIEVDKVFNLLTVEIPLSSSPGLGISFNMAKQGGQDCGIFIKKAKLKDCPLLVNDQLIEVNGIMLIGKSNSKAIEIITEELKQPSASGVIQFKVSRHKTPSSHFFTSFLSDNEPGSGIPDKLSFPPFSSAEPALHSESAASAEERAVVGERTFEDDGLKRKFSPTELTRLEGKTDNSINDFSSRNQTVSKELLEFSESNERRTSEIGSEDFIPDDSFDHSDPVPGFNREGFGRQSISEKRKGHVDPTAFDIYHKIRSHKDQKVDYDSRSWDPRKSTLNKSTERRREESFSKMGMRSKSMEDLQKLDKIATLIHHDATTQPVRKNNPSFLMAVDRYYESPKQHHPSPIDKDPASHPKDSILTLSKASLFPGLARTDRTDKADKKKSDMDKIRSIIKKGTDMFRFSKQRKSVDSKDAQELRRNLYKEPRSTSTFWVAEESDENANQNRKVTSILSDPEPLYADSCFSPLSGQECELEVTHFGADCITRIVKDDCGQQRQMNFPVESKFAYDRDLKQGPPIDSKTSRIQQLRSEHQRYHQERCGQYPLDDAEDEYEKQLRDQARSQMSSQQLVCSPQQLPSLQKKMDRRGLPQTRSRPQPISVLPEISAQLEYPEIYSGASSGYFSQDSQYSHFSNHPNSYNQYMNPAQKQNFYKIPDGSGAKELRIVEYPSSARLNNKGVASGHERAFERDRIRHSVAHERQKSSPISSLMPGPSGDRRHSFTEKLPEVSSFHVERTNSIYNQPSSSSSSQMTNYGGIISQSSRV